MTLPTRPLTVTINGRRYGPIDVPEGLMMIDVLHEMLGLTGSRLGCGIGICHACVVIWDRDDQTSEEVHTCDRHVLAFDVAGVFEALAKSAQTVPHHRVRRPDVEPPDHWHRWLLRARRERPRRRRRAAKK
jgi:aerobic-type carbon monoxide dehydrogenase small subunit (CoxS/CutS family)